jgi:hypothetical protein
MRQGLSFDPRISLHHAPELHFRNPRLKINTARPVIWHPIDETHVIQRPRRIRGELEGPKNKKGVYEY